MLKMEKTFAMMIFIASFLAVISKSNSQYHYRPAPAVPAPAYPTIRPLCVSQFSLVNHACSMLPFTPVSGSTSPPLPPPPPPMALGDSPCPPQTTTPPAPHRRGHHHRHRHSSNGSHSNNAPTVAEEECCRWLREVDTQCVCDLLVRLPPFLSKPGHDYTVMVNDDCSVSYNCPGRVML